MFGARQTLHAPHLLDVEAAHVLRRYAAIGEIDGEVGGAALADLMTSPCADTHTSSCCRACGLCGTTLLLMTVSTWLLRKYWTRRCSPATGALPQLPGAMCALRLFERQRAFA
jgi:hypothetical protein